ncbi:MAG: Hsp70 family protein, partial [Paracoccaceae bacterium]
IPPAPRGMPQIEVTFDIDVNGIVSVQAKDKGTNKEQKITIQASGGLSETDIEKMVKEAEENAEADKVRRAGVEAKNHAESLIHSTEKSLAEHGDKVGDDVKSAITAAIDELKTAVQGDDAEAITAKTQALTETAMKLGEAIYKSQMEEAAAEEGAGAEAPEGKAKTDDDVVDADFEEVKDEKKS